MTTHISDTTTIPALREWENNEDAHDRLLADWEAGGGICRQNAHGETLLMLVVQSAHPENKAIIRLLLDAGVDPLAKDIFSYTAWTYARIFGASPEVEALLNSPEKLIA